MFPACAKNKVLWDYSELATFSGVSQKYNFALWVSNPKCWTARLIRCVLCHCHNIGSVFCCRLEVHCEVAGGWHLSEAEKFLMDQNDQTERKMETEKRRREERLVSDSLLCFFFPAS